MEHLALARGESADGGGGGEDGRVRGRGGLQTVYGGVGDTHGLGGGFVPAEPNRDDRGTASGAIFGRVEAVGGEGVSDEGLRLKIHPAGTTLGVAGGGDGDRTGGVVATESYRNKPASFLTIKLLCL